MQFSMWKSCIGAVKDKCCKKAFFARATYIYLYYHIFLGTLTALLACLFVCGTSCVHCLSCFDDVLTPVVGQVKMKRWLPDLKWFNELVEFTEETSNIVGDNAPSMLTGGRFTAENFKVGYTQLADYIIQNSYKLQIFPLLSFSIKWCWNIFSTDICDTALPRLGWVPLPVSWRLLEKARKALSKTDF